MRRSFGGKVAGVAMAFAIAIAAAGCPQQNPASAPRYARFAYVTNPVEQSVSVYQVIATSGRLRPLGYVSFPKSLFELTSWGNWVFAQQGGAADVYSIDASSGFLSPTRAATIPQCTLPPFVSADGRYLFCEDLSQGHATVWALSFDAATGQAIPLGSVSVPHTLPVALDPLLRFMLVWNTNTDAISSITLSLTDPNKPMAVVASWSFGSSKVVIEPKGRWAYVGLANQQPTLTVVALNADGTPAGAPLQTLPVTVSPLMMKLAGRGDEIFIGDQTNAWQSFVIDGTTGMLSPSGRQLPAATGDIGFDPLGRFAYALATATGSVTTLGLGSSQTSRGVTIVDRAPSGWSSERIEIATGLAPAVTTSKLLLVTDFVRDVLDAYRIDPNDGTLTHVGDARTGGSGASWLAVSPDGRFAYVASSSSDTVGAFKVDPDSGAITAVGSQLALPGHPCRLVVDRATSSLIALVLAPAEIAFFPIDRTTGALSPVALEQPTSISSPSWLAVSNLGDAVLVADSQGAGQVDELPLRPQSAFQPRLLGPSFSWFPGTGTGHHTTGAIFDPFDHGVVAWGDRFVVWQNAGPSLTGPAGVLNPALPVSVVAAAPDGDALFSIFRDSSGAKVADVAIDPSTGAAHFIRYEIPFDASIKTPTAAVADASGHWFYVLDRDTRKIALFDRDTASGALQQQATIGIQGTSKQTVLVPRTSFSLRSMPIDMQIVDVTN